MRLFHVSEESDIEIFRPRNPVRDDMDKARGVVWAINDRALPNMLTPRNCPRVTYHVAEKTMHDDVERYLSTASLCHVVVIESAWFERMKNMQLYLYEFDPSEFELQDDIAGYYISYETQVPINKTLVPDLFAELFSRGVEVRIVDNLWTIWREIKGSSFNWSMCRMRNARPE